MKLMFLQKGLAALFCLGMTLSMIGCGLSPEDMQPLGKSKKSFGYYNPSDLWILPPQEKYTQPSGGDLQYKHPGQPVDPCASVQCNQGMTCVSGTCVKLCPQGKTNCNGLCVDLHSDSMNCGTCGQACGSAQPLCSQGKCQCNWGELSCNGRCVDIGRDWLNCGSCGNACGSDEFCAGGVCAKR